MKGHMLTLQVIKGLVALLTMLAVNQSSYGIFFIESWKKGETKIQEKEFLIEINTNNTNFETNIKDNGGNERYKLKVAASTIQINNKPCITGIRVYLSERDLLPEKNNLLTTIHDPDVDCISCGDLTEVVWALVPEGGDTGQLQFLTERIIKVESFYCIIKIKKYQFSGLRSSTLSSANIQIQFTNNSKCL